MKTYRSLLVDVGATALIMLDVFGLWGGIGTLAIFILLWNIRLNGGTLQFLKAEPVVLKGEDPQGPLETVQYKGRELLGIERKRVNSEDLPKPIGTEGEAKGGFDLHSDRRGPG